MPSKKSLNHKTTKKKSQPEQANMIQQPLVDGLLLQRMHTAPETLSPQNVLQLQPLFGNQAIGQMLGRRESSNGGKVQRKSMSIPWYPTRPVNSGSLIQPDRDLPFARVLQRMIGSSLSQPNNILPIQRDALTVGPANDKYEQEADNVAETLMRTPSDLENGVQPNMTTMVSKTVQPKALATLQRDGDGSFALEADFEDRLSRANSGGESLPSDVQTDFETKVGADVSRVKVHSGPESVQLSREIGARAFTYKNHIHTTAKEPHLLRHETVHTIQQGASPVQRKTNKPNQIQQTKVPTIQRTGRSGWPTKPYTYSLTNNRSEGFVRAKVGSFWGTTLYKDPSKIRNYQRAGDNKIGKLDKNEAVVVNPNRHVKDVKNRHWVRLVEPYWAYVKWNDLSITARDDFNKGDKFYGPFQAGYSLVIPEFDSKYDKTALPSNSDFVINLHDNKSMTTPTQKQMYKSYLQDGDDFWRERQKGWNKNNEGISWGQASMVSLYETLKTGGHIRFLIDHIDPASPVNTRNQKIYQASTSHELRFVYRNWNIFRGHVTFYRNNRVSEPPWVLAQEAWENYDQRQNNKN